MSGLLNVGVNFVELRYEQLGRKLKQERSQNERWRLKKKQLRIVGRNGTLVDVCASLSILWPFSVWVFVLKPSSSVMNVLYYFRAFATSKLTASSTHGVLIY